MHYKTILQLLNHGRLVALTEAACQPSMWVKVIHCELFFSNLFVSNFSLSLSHFMLYPKGMIWDSLYERCHVYFKCVIHLQTYTPINQDYFE